VDLDLSLAAPDLTAQLVDAESVSGAEKPLADAIEAALRPLPHLAVHRDGNVITARTSLGRDQRVVLAGHIDTVPVADNLPSRLERGVLYGCGSTDMKSGVAVQLRLAALVPEPNRDVTYVFYDCEEVEAERNGLLRVSRNSPDLLAGDLAVLMEPTDGLVEGGCQGTLRAEIVANGKRAHSARSWMARRSTQAPTSTMMPFSSMSGMKRSGGRNPSSGFCQRSSASSPMIRRVRRSTLGW